MKSIGPHYYALIMIAGFLYLSVQVSASSDAGNMTVTAPAPPTTAQSGTISLTFSGLTAGTKYLGSAAYSCASGMPNPTIVRVDP